MNPGHQSLAVQGKNAGAQTDRKRTQRERLLDAMVHIAVRDGYPTTTIAEVIACAGVSRPTFYEYFIDKDDCFLAALAEVQRSVLEATSRAVASPPGEQALEATITTLTAFAAADPHRAHFLMSEPLAGGPRTLDARDHGLGQTASVIERAHTKLGPEIATPDLPADVMLGTVHRLLGRQLRRGGQVDDHTQDELLRWAQSYRRPIAEHRWRLEEATAPTEPWGILPETLLREPPALPRHPGRDGKTVAQHQRQRILFAAAAVAQEKGYAATTIAEIRKRAGVDRRAFKALFADKQHVYMDLIGLGFHRTMAASAGAFAAAGSWPDRVWEAGRAFTGFLGGSPALAHVGFVESHAIGPDAAQHVEEILDAFTIFLHEGVHDAHTGEQALSDLAMQAVATAIFETGYRESRRNEANITGVLAPVTFLCLAPVIGAAEADGFIDRRLAGTAATGLARSKANGRG
jgi:AcrR family transcriptional regulator